MSIRILITDDHAAIREQLKSVLGKQTDLEVVAEADDGQSAVKLAKELVPNVVLMDLAMPKMNGIEATRNILRENASIRIIILSEYCEKPFVVAALKAGISGYVVKSSLFDDLIRAIRAVMANEFFLSSTITGVVIADYIKRLPIPDE